MNGPKAKIDSIHIRGFRSLANVSLSELPSVSIMIGPNGSGKSNVIRFFELLHWMLRSRRLARFVAEQGGADDQLFGGSKTTSDIEATLGIRTETGICKYSFSLSHAQPDRFILDRESIEWHQEGEKRIGWHVPTQMREESLLVEFIQEESKSKSESIGQIFGVNILNLIRVAQDHRVYQFHDTSDKSSMKVSSDIHDNHYLHGHGGNLAAILFRLEHEDVRRYDLICRHIGRVLPAFDRFVIEESYGRVLLRWKAKWTDKTFGAHLTSDGSLRFFALVTLLNLPSEMLPSVILLDEPELGLHPAAVGLVAAMMKQLSHDKQIIVATQSPLLVDEFELDEIIVLDLEDGRTKLRKLNSDDYRVWLQQDYTPSQLWQKNLLGGRP